MKSFRLKTLCWLALTASILHAQPVTRALVVGISDYQDSRITDLSYADRDAEVFADYLRSKAGGFVRSEHLRLLTNEEATLAAVNDGLDWLMTNTQKGDRVFVYFSGHGDVEKQTLWQLGYLLAYDPPFNNYRNNAVRIEDLNDLVTTLSVGREARVVIITDACRSGKLAGSDNRGPSLTAEQLAKKTANEVRIMSCKPDQVSLESQAWGGGRGVFSYYLVNGLKGLADSETDDRVTLYELETFLKPKVRQEAQEHSRGIRQDPVFIGDENFRLAIVDEATLISLKKEAATPGIALALKSFDNSDKDMLSRSDSLSIQLDEFFNIIQTEKLLEFIDLQKVIKTKRENIAQAFIQEIRSINLIQNDDEGSTTNIPYAAVDQLAAIPAWQKKIEHHMMIALHDLGQEKINLYLKGDTTELNVRQFYNADSSYKNYPLLFELALKLVDPSHPLYTALQVKYHYFTGLLIRLDAQKKEKPKTLLLQAIMEQEKALKIDSVSAYVFNELGLLYDVQKKYQYAEKYYNKAIELAPNWALPWSNLAGMYVISGQPGKGKDAGEKAIAFQPALWGPYFNTGLAYEHEGNLLRAIELYSKSINRNNQAFLPFERTGYVYLLVTNYSKSDSIFAIAEEIKTRVIDIEWLPEEMEDIGVARATPMSSSGSIDAKEDIEKSLLEAISKDTNNINAYFQLGQLYARSYRNKEARKTYKKVIELYPNHPQVYTELASLAIKQGQYEEAEIALKRALEKYSDTLNHLYGLGNLYKNWQRFDEAAKIYKKVIERISATEKIPFSYNKTLVSISPKRAIAYSPSGSIESGTILKNSLFSLFNILKKTGRYDEAELVLNDYARIDLDSGVYQLGKFYNDMIEKYPNQPIWHYKSGILHYESGRAKESISELQKVLELKSDYPARLDILQKIGDMYLHQDSLDEALANYLSALDTQFVIRDISPRLKIIGIFDTLYSYQNALKQLEYLLQQDKIDYPRRLLLAKYYIYAGNFTEAEKLLTTAEEIALFKDPAVVNLWALLYLRSNNWEQAIHQYQKYIDLRGEDADIRYSIARAQAGWGHKQQALDGLQTALAAGFSCRKVLKYDPVWVDYRTEPSWTALIQKYLPE